jgi:outer membrane receptor protein involved in Fe transport
MSQPENMLNNKSYGLEFTLQQDIFAWWKFDASYSYYKFIVSGSYEDVNLTTHKPQIVDLTSSNYTWNARFNTNISYEKIMDFQISGYYNAPSKNAQSSSKASYSMDMAIKYNIMEGNASFNFRVSDIFNTQRHEHSSYSYNFNIDTYYKRASRVAYLGFTYRFNDYKKQSGKRNGDDRDVMEMD